jgi:hypothetical protein
LGSGSSRPCPRSVLLRLLGSRRRARSSAVVCLTPGAPLAG